MREVGPNRFAVPKEKVAGEVAVGEVLQDGLIQPTETGEWKKTGIRVDEITEDEYIGTLVDL
jgi:hypothetical protein